MSNIRTKYQKTYILNQINAGIVQLKLMSTMYVEMPIDIMNVSILHEHIESDNEPT